MNTLSLKYRKARILSFNNMKDLPIDVLRKVKLIRNPTVGRLLILLTQPWWYVSVILETAWSIRGVDCTW